MTDHHLLLVTEADLYTAMGSLFGQRPKEQVSNRVLKSQEVMTALTCNG